MNLKQILLSSLVIGVLASSACARKEHAGEAQQNENTSVESKAQPDLWEPVDKAFKGCEGG